MRALLTGASGFVGSHVLEHLLKNTDMEFVCPVTFRHKGVPARLHHVLDLDPSYAGRVNTVMLDLTAPLDHVTMRLIGPVDAILNVASESHVDRSIESPGVFIRNNTDLITNVLDYARAIRPRIVLQMSTDEVYGPAYGTERHQEWSTIAPSNPYSASKAAQEAIAFSYWRTYGVPVVITNTMNIIGERQDAEKMVPKAVRAVLRGEPMTVHTDPDGVPGSRFYLHARNLADAWLHLLNNHIPQSYADGDLFPSRFNIVGEREVDNAELVNMIGASLGKDPKIERVSFHESRPGHDLRYALDGRRMADAGWSAPVPFWFSLNRTVEWYARNLEWLGL